jgi:excisionase family DNA binding protein
MRRNAPQTPSNVRAELHTNGGLEFTVRLDGDQLDELAHRVASLLAAQPAGPTANGWVDAAGAAEHLSTSRDRVYDLVALRKLEPRRDGRRLLFRLADLDDYLEHAA